MRLDHLTLPVVFALLCLAFGAAEISAQKGLKPLSTIYVDSKEGADSAKCGSTSNPCKTINKAIENTEPRGSIELVRKDTNPRESRDCNFPYAPTTISKSVTIKASGGSGMPCISTWTDNNPGITITRDENAPATELNVEIIGLRFLRAKRLDSVGTVGIIQLSGTSLIVKNCYFAENFEGIRFAEGELTVRGTSFINNGIGLWLKGNTKKTATIENSAFKITTQAAIRAEVQSEVTVSNSTISVRQNNGIPFEAVGNKSVSSDDVIIFRVQDSTIGPTLGNPLMIVRKDSHSDAKLFMKNVIVK